VAADDVSIKNAWSCTSTPPIRLVAWCLVKHRDNFSFTFSYFAVKICGTDLVGSGGGLDPSYHIMQCVRP